MKPGERYGRWVVIGTFAGTARDGVPCRCDCGTEREVKADNLRHGASQCCGCLRVEVNRAARQVIHGRGRYIHRGCRCDICRAAESEYRRQWRRDQKEITA